MKKIILLFTAVVFSLSAASLDDKIAYLDNVKELVVLTQKMRGDTNVYIKGGHIVLPDINNDRDNVADSLRALHSKFQTVNIETNGKFVQLNHYMQSLNEVAAELDTMTTFRAYSLLIKEMLKLGVNVQENLFIDTTKRQQQFSSSMMTDILPMTEHIGRLRGLGAGIAATGQFDDDELTFAKEYFVDFDDDLKKMVAGIKALNIAYPGSYPKNLDRQLDKYQKDVKEYIRLIEARLTNDESDKVSIDAYDFFSRGTSLIDDTLSFYEMNMIILKEQ